MKYRIICRGKVIAEFVTKPDRDVCIAALREYWDDAKFVPKDDEYRFPPRPASRSKHPPADLQSRLPAPGGGENL